MHDIDQSKRHEMELEAVYVEGVEEWHCPTCGRHVLVQYPDYHDKVILDPGDSGAIHTGPAGDMRSLPGPAAEDDVNDYGYEFDQAYTHGHAYGYADASDANYGDDIDAGLDMKTAHSVSESLWEEWLADLDLSPLD